MENVSNLIDAIVEDTQSAAIVLSLSNSVATENILKEYCKEKGFKCAVTEFGGTDSEFKKKIVNSVVGACLNKEIITKTATDIHAVIHATEEAIKGFILTNGMSSNLAVKIAIVRKDKWISVAFTGYSAIHYLTNHKRACVGTMHI